MHRFKILPFLFVFFLFAGCKDEYKEFKETPSYISDPTKQQEAYFEAYDKVLQKWDVKYEELYISTSHGIAHVIVSGPKKAVPLVLLHGVNASSTMWYPNANALTEEYRIYAIDLIVEPGKSLKTADFKNIDDLTEWYQEVLWALKLDSFHIIGASRGGWLAVNLALKSKRDIRSLVLLSPAQTFVWIPPSTGLLKTIVNVFSSDEKQVEATLETMSSRPGNIDKDYVKQYHLSKKNDTLTKFMMEMTPFSTSDLQTLKMPVLVLIGDDDMINTKRAIRLAEKHIPKGRGEIILNAGHFLSVDQAETVNKKMLDFLRSVDKAK
ncbi:MAG TPA: alpha/beta hydrolase [Aequorivita sp.]|nr:alpha/beta hydrolase [Aequorivita sp.]